MSAKLLRPDQSQKGFTLIELIFATVFFSLLLMLVVSAFVQINRSYTRGYKTKQTQDAGRALLEDVVRTIRNSRGSLVIYDEPGESGLVSANTDPSPISASVLRLCAEDRRFAWNEYNLDNTSGWGINQLTNEHTRYYDQNNNFLRNEFITASKTDVANSAPQNGIATCTDPLDFTYIGTTTSALSTEMTIHDLDVDLIATGGPAAAETYRVVLVLATADVPSWLDRKDFSLSWVKKRSIFASKGNIDADGVIEPVCLVGDGSEYCKVIRYETIVSTRN